MTTQPVADTRKTYTFVLFASIAIINLFDMILPGALITPIVQDLGISDTEAARIMTAFTIAYVIGAPLHGFLGDRFPRKPIILAGLILWSAASVGSGFAGGLLSLLVWRALVGFGEGAFRAHQNSWLADTFEPKQRGAVFSVFSGLGSIAFALSYIVGSWLAEQYGWRTAFVVSGVPGLIAAWFLFRLAEPKRGGLDPAPAALKKPGWPEVKALLSSYPFIVFTLGSAALQFAFSNANFWGAVYMHREFGISNREAAQFWGFAYLFLGFGGAALFGVAATHLIRKSGAISLYALFGVLTTLTAGTAMALALSSSTLLGVKVWFALEVLASTAFFGVQVVLLFEIAPVALRGTAVALNGVFTLVSANILKSEVVGRVSDAHGIGQALWLIPVGFAISAAAWAVLAIHLHKQRQPLAAAPAPVPAE